MSEGISWVYHHTDKALLSFLIMAFESTQLSSFETSTINIKSQLSILCIFWNGNVNYHVFYPIFILIYLLCGKELWNHILQIKFHHWHPKKTKILLQQLAKNLGCQCCWLMLLSLSSQCLFPLYTAWYITQ